MPAKAHLLNLPCFRFLPLPLRTTLFCDYKIGVTGPFTTLLEFWDNDLANQHCFGDEGVFEHRFQIFKTVGVKFYVLFL